MPKHISRAEFTRRFLALVDRLSEDDRGTLSDAWAGYHILTRGEHERIIEIIIETANPEIRRSQEKARRIVSSPNFRRNEDVKRLARAGKTPGEIRRDLRATYPSLTVVNIKEIRDRAGI